MGGAIVVCLIAYFLNWSGRYTTARCIICLIPVVSSLVLPLIYGDVKPVALFWYPLAAMGYSLLPYVFFDVEKERNMFWCMFGFHLMVVIYIPVFVHTGKYSTTETREYLCSPSFRVAYTLIYLLINLSVLALVRVNKYYENQIYAMNNSLEKIIEKRTTELMERNVQLSQYAFMNSHKVRGPLARILGLLTLWKENITDEEREEIHFKMDHAAHELDEVVSEMNRKLNE
jgi:signal transduction histidine kinase